MFCIMENHFLFVGFVLGNAETQTFSVSQNLNSFGLPEYRTRRSGT